jgi:hypothetical protein
MAGTQFDEPELLALVNEGLPANQQLQNAQALINLIYGGAPPQGVPQADRVSAAQLLILVNQVINNNQLVNSFARIMGTRTNEAIVSLINSHNPYTSNEMLDMTVFTGNPDFSEWANNRSNQIEVEIDGPYTTPKEWYFKSLPQQINKALRIKYRYRARDLGNPNRPLLGLPHWITAYMLIGYEDGGA